MQVVKVINGLLGVVTQIFFLLLIFALFTHTASNGVELWGKVNLILFFLLNVVFYTKAYGDGWENILALWTLSLLMLSINTLLLILPIMFIAKLFDSPHFSEVNYAQLSIYSFSVLILIPVFSSLHTFLSNEKDEAPKQKIKEDTDTSQTSVTSNGQASLALSVFENKINESCGCSIDDLFIYYKEKINTDITKSEIRDLIKNLVAHGHLREEFDIDKEKYIYNIREKSVVDEDFQSLE
ncbi:hypothetical protein HOF92_11335 [bacterium]|jgi:hypothetical protein|nr:hypothetical protein [bacterium]